MTRTVAIVGAGVAGSAAAAELDRAGVAARIYDKGRAIGGRLATRTGAAGPFEHGAQYYRLSDRPFSRVLAEHPAEIAAWRPRPAMPMATDTYRVGRTRMSDLISPLLSGVEVSLEKTVSALEREQGGWRLCFSDGSHAGGFAGVLVAIPAPQAAALVARFSPTLSRCNEGVMDPVWCAMVAFEKPVIPAIDLLVDVAPEIMWASRDNSRPGRNAGADRWVLHATVEWSRRHLELEKPDAADRLMASFRRHPAVRESAVGATTHLVGHRWRYGRVRKALDAACLVDARIGIAVAGDWCLGPDIDDAYESGVAAGRALAAVLS